MRSTGGGSASTTRNSSRAEKKEPPLQKHTAVLLQVDHKEVRGTVQDFDAASHWYAINVPGHNNPLKRRRSQIEPQGDGAE